MDEKRIIIDVETTGTDHKKHGLTQLAGVILVNGQRKEFDFNVSPFKRDIIEKEALEITGKTEKEILSYQDPIEVYKEFKKLLLNYVDPYNKKDKFTFYGYNSTFDENFIREFFYKCNDKYYGSLFWYPSIDIMRLWAYRLKDERNRLVNFKLKTVCDYLAIELENAHDAMSDVLATEELLNLL